VFVVQCRAIAIIALPKCQTSQMNAHREFEKPASLTVMTLNTISMVHHAVDVLLTK
jgi:hypothetical protein